MRAKLKKDSSLQIQEFREIQQSYLDLFEKPSAYLDSEDAVTDLTYLFSDIKDAMNIKRESIYIVLPDYLFDYMDCIHYDTQDELEAQILSSTGRAMEELYYVVPIITKPAPQETWGTVYAIQRKVIDLFIKAAEMQNARLYSIEPSSLSLLRSTGQFSKEEFVFQSFEKQATFIAYSSIAGAFKMDIPELSMENLGNMETNAANALIQASLIQFESTAEQTFTFMNQGIPFVLLANPVQVRSFPAFVERAAERQRFPDYVDCGEQIEPQEEQDWMCAVGTLLQGMDYTQDKFIDEGIIDAYEEIRSGNVLPDDIQKNTKAYQFLQKCKRLSVVGIGALSVALVAEIVGIFAMSSVEVPPSLQKDYAAAQASSQEIDNELAVIELAGKEHEYPIEVMSALTQAKPAGLGFVNVDIGSSVTGSKDTWIKLKVVAADPLLFQQFAGALSRNDMFSNVNIAQIGASGGNAAVKTADITIGKKDAQQEPSNGNGAPKEGEKK